ncbi:sulfotransferase family protein [Pontibaca salina]|uniref:Sulfotransferase n=1 Tax=Pontibaca salina TaxID=2795731 RepID=A0A934M279_9RHOB|nr:sulfotransferase [Pontibaca salina]
MTLFAKILKKWKADQCGNPALRLPEFEYNNHPTINRIIFICGLHRSGTTLLERLLSSKFDVSYLRASVPESEGQHMQSVYKPAYEYGGPGRFAFSEQAYQDVEALTDFHMHRNKITDEWKNFVVGKSEVLLEKSPPNLIKIDWLRRVFPGSQFVIMTRDPRAVAAATLKWSKSSLPELMMHWGAAHSQALKAFRERDCTIVRYEDLIKDSNYELERTAHFLGLEARKRCSALEERHIELVNTNEKYIKAHAGARYGSGIWNHFGYDLSS